MKYLLFVFIAVSSTIASAGELVKACSFTIKVPGNSKSALTTYQIFKDGSKLTAKTVQTVDGQTGELPLESVVMSEHSVRPNLTSKTNDMNLAEQLIAGTVEFLQSPEIGKSFSVGLDLKQFKNAKVYVIGKVPHMGGPAIVEARDESGKNLGSFVTGFMPFACVP